MTHANTLRALQAERNRRFDDAAKATKRNLSQATDLHHTAKEAREHLIVAADLSAVLRSLDPERAADYADPVTSQVVLADEIGSFATMIASTPLELGTRKPRINLSIDLPEDEARTFMNRLMHTAAWQVEEHTGPVHTWLTAELSDGAVQMVVDAWFTRTKAPAETPADPVAHLDAEDGDS